VAKRLRTVVLNSEGRISGQLANILKAAAVQGLGVAAALSDSGNQEPAGTVSLGSAVGTDRAATTIWGTSWKVASGSRSGQWDLGISHE